MRVLLTAFVVLMLCGAGSATQLGLLLDDYEVLPYEEPEPVGKESELQELEIEVIEEQAEVFVKAEPKPKPGKKKIEPEVIIQKVEPAKAERVKPEKTAAEAGEIVPVAKVPAVVKEAPKEELPVETDRIMTVVQIQRAIALQNARNQLSELKQNQLKITLEKEILKRDIQELQHPVEKAKTTDKPVFIQGGRHEYSEVFAEAPAFGVIMISSVEGGRALVRDGANIYYVRKGGRVSFGEVSDITAQGVWVFQEGGEVLYPVAQ